MKEQAYKKRHRQCIPGENVCLVLNNGSVNLHHLHCLAHLDSERHGVDRGPYTELDAAAVQVSLVLSEPMVSRNG